MKSLNVESQSQSTNNQSTSGIPSGVPTTTGNIMKEYIKQQIIGTAFVFVALMTLPLSLAIIFHFLGV